MVTTTIEAVLFAAAKPIRIKDLQKHLELSQEVVREALDALAAQRNTTNSGIHLIEHNEAVQLVSHPELAQDVAKFLRVEASGPLTRPSLETLTIIAYRGPITKPEIEMIRGVNCSLIIRNLLIRGFVVEEQDTKKLQPIYTVSHEFLQALGIATLRDLPEYHAFQTNQKITELLSREPQETSDV